MCHHDGGNNHTEMGLLDASSCATRNLSALCSNYQHLSKLSESTFLHHRITNLAQLRSPGKGPVDSPRAGVHAGVSIPALQPIRPQCRAPKVAVAAQSDAERAEINSFSPAPRCSTSCYSKTPLRPKTESTPKASVLCHLALLGRREEEEHG